MPEKVAPGPVSDDRCIREAVCIHTKKIFDSCKDKDCIEDLRSIPPAGRRRSLTGPCRSSRDSRAAVRLHRCGRRIQPRVLYRGCAVFLSDHR